MTINLYSSSEAQVLSTRQKQYERMFGVKLDAKSAAYLASGGRQDAVINRIGVELGINETGADNNLSFYKYVSAEKNSNDILFQGNNGNLYNIDFSKGKVETIDEKKWVDENFVGLMLQNQETGEFDYSDRQYDAFKFGQDNAEFINYSFEGTADGCKTISVDASWAFGSSEETKINKKWGDKIQWSYKEVNITNPSSDFVNHVLKNATSYISKQEAAEIIQKDGYSKYYDKLFQKAAEAMQYNDNSDLAEFYKQKAEEEKQKAEQESEEQKQEEQNALLGQQQ